MVTILWTQNETPNEKETFIINGVVSTYDGSPVQDKAFALLLDARKRKCGLSLKNVNMKKMFHDLDFSENLQCYQSSKGTLIQASYNETDKSGRKMPYMFFTDSTDWETIIRQLNENSEKIRRTCHAMDLEVLKQWSERSTQKKRFFLLAGIIGSSVLLIILILSMLQWS